MKKIFVASKNKGKIEEIRTFLTKLGYEIFSLLDTPHIHDVDETGNSFEDNALLKAKTIFQIVNIPVLADDSGLEVDHLNGRPGIFSARYSGKNATDKSNIDKLLQELEGVKLNERTARFKCVICLYDGVSERFFDGICEGFIITSPRGEKGFGYDPIFIPKEYTLTFSELGLDVKNQISHRGKALKSFREFLELEEKV